MKYILYFSIFFFSLSLNAQVTAGEKAALQAVYTALGGPNWLSENDSDPTNDWDFSQPVTSDWFGIEVDGGHVVELIVTNFSIPGKNNAIGYIPAEIGDFPFLRKLAIAYADCSGTTIPAEIGQLDSLRSIDLAHSNLEGLIPNTIGNLKKLRTLYASNNMLSGSIPTTIGQLKDLKYLQFDYNDLTDIPDEICALTSLKSLYLYGNKFTCELPLNFGNLTNLESLWIQDNPGLTGPIPTSVGNLTKLKWIWMSNTGILGPLPNTVGGWTNIKVIDITNNPNLDGEIPAAFGSLSTLVRFGMGANNLSDSIPDLSGLTSIEMISLSDNKLAGAIPASMGNLATLERLFLDENKLTGPLPKELGQLKKLEVLYLSDNNFDGSIPPAFGGMTVLNTLNLNNAGLSGALPKELGQLTEMEWFFVGYNNLSGTIPSEYSAWTNADWLNFSKNHFSGKLPDFRTLSLSTLGITSNAFQFGDYEAEFDWYEANAGILDDYQAKLDSTETKNVTTGDNITLVTNCSGSKNHYKWSKDGSPIGGDFSTLNLTNIQLSDAGDYTCEVTSEIVTGLTLYRNPVTIDVVAKPSANEAPGGVINNNVFWVRADAGVLFASLDVATWMDQSNGGNDAAQSTAAYRPSFISSLHNYNPSVHFDGTNEYLSMNNLIAAGSKNLSVFVVGTNEQGGDSWHAMVLGQSNSGWTGGGYGVSGLGGASTDFSFWVNDYGFQEVTAPLIKNKITILEGKYNSTQIELYQNAYLEGTNAYSGIIGDNGTTHLGGGVGTDYNHKGYISEVAIYDTDLSVNDRRKVNSYLAIKYATTLDRSGMANNYINSAGNSIFTAVPKYWNDIIGIVRDDNSTLAQKQAHLTNDSTRIYLAVIKTRNETNAGVFSTDLQSVILGSDAGQMYATEATLTDKPSGVFRLLDRSWQLTNTDFDGTFSIDIVLDDCAFVNPITVSDIRVLLDDDGDFTDAQILDNSNITISLDGTTVTIGNITNSQLPENSTAFLSLGSLTNPVLTMPYNMTLCTGASLDVNGTLYDVNNPTGIEVLTSSHGCDSLVNVNLTYTQAVETNLNQDLCTGGSLLVNGIVYDESNPAGTETISTASGCDSLVHVSLTFGGVIETNYNQELCFGESIDVNGNTYDAATPTGTETLTAMSGCDSLVHVSLTFKEVIETDFTQELCFGASILINGNTYDAVNSNGTEKMTAMSGCDSLVHINLMILNQIQTDLDQMICKGGSLVVNGTTYDGATPTGSETLTSFQGCDSIVNISLTFEESIQTDYEPKLCAGEKVVVNGTIYNASNTSGSETFSSSQGCDSIVNINISFLEALGTAYEPKVCEGSSVVVNGTTYDGSNPFGVETITSSQGCDSIVDVKLIFVAPAQTDLIQTLCKGEEVMINGVAYSEVNPTGTEVLMSSMGCDSIINISLNFTNALSVAKDTTICMGGSLEIGGQVFDVDNPAGTVTLTSVKGCDSIVQISLSFFDGGPEVVDDNFIMSHSGEKTFDFLVNDVLPENWVIEIINANHSDYWVLNEDNQLVVFGDKASSGEALSISYQICDERCGDLCAAGEIYISFDYPKNQKDVIVSDVLTLNGDGKNDILFFKGVNLSTNEGLVVFNRWGDLVFSEMPYMNGWDGRSKNGKDLPSGTYYYVLYLNRAEGNTIKGDVLLVR